MEGTSRIPPGVSLLLVGSGLYWLLSSQLISSFTVLSPGLFESIPLGQTLVTVTGIISVTAGLWIVKIDLNEFQRLTAANEGYVFVLPLALVSLDIYSTLVDLSLNSQVMELNPFVASAIQYGSAAVVSFLISYLALSQGLALLMLTTGRWLFGEAKAAKVLPFSLVCGGSSFGPFSNLMGMGVGYDSFLVYLVAAAGSALLAAIVFRVLRNATTLSAAVSY